MTDVANEPLSLPRDPAEALSELLCLPKPGVPPESRLGRISDRVIRGATFMVRDCGLTDLLTSYRKIDEPDLGKKGGRPALADEEIVLIILIAIVAAGDAPLVTNVAHAYRARLSSPARDLLGLPRVEKTPEKAIYFRVYRALHRILEPLDPYPGPRRKRLTRVEHEELEQEWLSAEQQIGDETFKVVDVRLERLRTITNLLLESAFLLLPAEARKAWKGNICIDATVVRAGGKGGAPSKKASNKPSDKMSVVPQTGWYTRQDESGKTTKSAWGFEAHLVVMCANDPSEAADFPLLVLGMSLDTPASRVGENAVIAAKSVIDRGHPAGICAADRAYFPNCVPRNYQLPMRALGYTLIGDYRIDQLGVQAQRDGAILVEGSWYCPSMPEPLINATVDVRQGKITQSTYEARIDQRGRYLFRPKQSPTPDGNVVYQCPARGSGATAKCPIVGQPKGKITDLTLITKPPTNPDKACTNSSSITLPIAPDPSSKSADDTRAKYYQDVRYATSAWKALWSTLRNTVEGVNGYNKDPNWSDIEEAGRRRMRGFAAQAFLLACQILGSNIRKIETFMLKSTTTPTPAPQTKQTSRRHKTTPDLARFKPGSSDPPLAQPA